MRDVLRGRLTGRLDLAARIERADLPVPAKQLVARVVLKSRLWSIEKLDVADELIAHFRDGLETGQGIPDLIRLFGDETRAVKLIRRAKRRNRPIAWHALRGLCWLVVALVAIYLLLAAYFYTGHPTISVNYFDRFNARADAVPVDQRAWFAYREAILQIGHRPLTDRAEFQKLLDARPGGGRWQDMVEWLRANGSALDLIHAASQKPELGFILGPNGSAVDPQLFPDATTQPADADLISTRIPHVAELRRLAYLLAQDARLAREESDPKRFLANAGAILNIARQLHGQGFLIADSVAVHIRGVALDLIDDALANKPTLFSDDDLQRVAHLLSDVHTSADLFDARGERWLIEDVVQRTYTDDGHGDGRLTPAGLNYLRLISGGGRTDTTSTMMLAYGPASPVIGASRKELLDEYNRMLDDAAANWARPLREVDWNGFYDRIDKIKDSAGLRAKFFPLMLLVPAMSNPQRNAELYMGHRDGIVTAIALELYRRAHGKYPDSLDALTPALLPSVPVDRITGDPVRYRIADGKPLIYSLGADRDNDGGRAATRGSAEAEAVRAALWQVPSNQLPDGDWILFPQRNDGQ